MELYVIFHALDKVAVSKEFYLAEVERDISNYHLIKLKIIKKLS